MKYKSLKFEQVIGFKAIKIFGGRKSSENLYNGLTIETYRIRQTFFTPLFSSLSESNICLREYKMCVIIKQQFLLYFSLQIDWRT